jgi:hypothetical protein
MSFSIFCSFAFYIPGMADTSGSMVKAPCSKKYHGLEHWAFLRLCNALVIKAGAALECAAGWFHVEALWNNEEKQKTKNKTKPALTRRSPSFKNTIKQRSMA